MKSIALISSAFLLVSCASMTDAIKINMHMKTYLDDNIGYAEFHGKHILIAPLRAEDVEIFPTQDHDAYAALRPNRFIPISESYTLKNCPKPFDNA